MEKLSDRIEGIKNEEFDSFLQTVEDRLQDLRDKDQDSDRFKRAIEHLKRFF